MQRLLFDGKDGSVFCKVYDIKSASYLPSMSKSGNLTCKSRTILQMSNLTVVRNKCNCSAMYGPCDFFQSLEDLTRPNLFFSILVDGLQSKCFFHEHYKNSPNIQQILHFPDGVISEHVMWKSHFFKKSAASIFPKPGILVFLKTEEITFPKINHVGDLNLSEFRARIVKNNEPFALNIGRNATSEQYDNLRVISYTFGKNHGLHQMKTAGLFLEYHSFIQTMTPLHCETSTGFVILAKWRIKNTLLDMIAVSIPFGFTLICDPMCIHGDMTLKGKYCMAMTSNHLSMATANTVFLKTRNNLNIKCSNLISDHCEDRCDSMIISERPTFNNFDIKSEK